MTAAKSTATSSDDAKAAIYIAPAVEEDYNQLVERNHDVLEKNDPLLEAILVHPECAAHDITKTRKRFTDPTNMTLKAVVRGGGSGCDKVVGYVQLKRCRDQQSGIRNTMISDSTNCLLYRVSGFSIPS